MRTSERRRRKRIETQESDMSKPKPSRGWTKPAREWMQKRGTWNWRAAQLRSRGSVVVAAFLVLACGDCQATRSADGPVVWNKVLPPLTVDPKLLQPPVNTNCREERKSEYMIDELIAVLVCERKLRKDAEAKLLALQTIVLEQQRQVGGR